MTGPTQHLVDTGTEPGARSDVDPTPGPDLATPSPEEPVRGGIGPRGAVLVLAAGLLAALLFLMLRGSLTDDAYITLAYAKNLALHFHWGVTPQEIANTATSPLNVLLLGALSAITRVTGSVHPVFALGALTVALAMVLAFALTRIAGALRLPLWSAAAGVVLVLLNPFLLSALGLEVLLVPTLLALLVALAVERRPVWFGAVAGLALVARLDLVLFVLLIAAATAAVRRRWLPALVALVCVAAPWFVFSWLFFGSAVPDTLVIKTSQGALFAPWSYVSGPVMYFLGRSVVVMVAFAPAVVGVLALAVWLVVRTSVRWSGTDPLPRIGPVAALGGGGVLYYTVYSIMKVGPYHWYYVPPMTSLSMFLALAVGAWLATSRSHARLRAGVPATVLGLVGLLALGNGAVDVKQGVPWASPVIFGNWASASDYARVGTALGRRIGGATVASPGEIGTLAYFCDCAIVDEFSDRGRAIGLINAKIANSGIVGRTFYRLNYAFLDRNQKPRPLDYRLEYTPGPGSGPDTWQVYSAAKGVGHFTLVPAS